MEQSFTQWWEANLKDITADGPLFTVHEMKWWVEAAMTGRTPSQSGLPLPPSSEGSQSPSFDCVRCGNQGMPSCPECGRPPVQSPPGDLLAVEMEAILKQMETVPWAVSTITIRDWAKGIRDALASPPPVSLPEGLELEVPTRDDLLAYIQGAVPFLEEAWAACFGGRKTKMLSAEERGMGQLLGQFKALAAGKRIMPPDCVTLKECREQVESATAWAHRTLGNPNELNKELQEWVHAGETCADGLKRANAEVIRLRAPAPLGEAPKPEAPAPVSDSKWCISCGLPRGWHRPGDYATGSNGKPCTEFKPNPLGSGLRPVPEPSPVVEPAPTRREGEPAIIWALVNKYGAVTNPTPVEPQPGNSWEGNKQWRYQKFVVESPAPLVKGGVVETGKGGQS